MSLTYLNNFCVYCLIGLKLAGEVDILTSLVYTKIKMFYLLYVAYISSIKFKLSICGGVGRGTQHLTQT